MRSQSFPEISGRSRSEALVQFSCQSRCWIVPDVPGGQPATESDQMRAIGVSVEEVALDGGADPRDEFIHRCRGDLGQLEHIAGDDQAGDLRGDEVGP